MVKRTLLIVDDEDNIRNSLQRILRRDGYQILQANSGKKGLELLEQNPEIGVILSDQRMPNMTGTEFLTQARELSPDTVRMVLSGYTDLNTVTDSINQGAIYKFLTKPWNDELLRANILEAFEHFELKFENERLAQELQKINSDLEKRVAENTRDLVLNIHALETSQEVLECLPVGVLGVDDDGMVVLANNEASNQLNQNDVSLIGVLVESILPLEICQQIKLCLKGEETQISQIKFNKVNIRVTCRLMAQSSRAKGAIVVMMSI